MLANNYLPFNEVFGIVRYLPMEIKMNKIFTSALLLLVALTTGCSINHPVAKDYDQHLAKFGSETNLPKSDLQAEYSIAKKTVNHNYQFRAATVGYAHVWIVEFGKILDKTRELVIKTFSKHGGNVKDGMDISLCVFQDNKVIYSGANNPLWIVRKSEHITTDQLERKSTLSNPQQSIIEFKADKQHIGINDQLNPFAQTQR